MKIKIGDKIYTPNLDFRNIIECDKIARDTTIGDYERVLALLYKFYGEDGINIPEHYEKLLKWAVNYISMGSEKNNKEPDFDLEQDKKYIASSFKYDYNYNPYEKEYLSWEDFYNDLSNLSDNELGNCCVLSRVRNLRNFDTSKIKDSKERNQIEEAKKRVALKKEEKTYTEEEIKNMEAFFQNIERS